MRVSSTSLVYHYYLGGDLTDVFYFLTLLAKWSNLTTIAQMGGNQPLIFSMIYFLGQIVFSLHPCPPHILIILVEDFQFLPKIFLPLGWKPTTSQFSWRKSDTSTDYEVIASVKESGIEVQSLLRISASRFAADGSLRVCVFCCENVEFRKGNQNSRRKSTKKILI